MNPRKLLIIGTLMIACGYVGFLLGKQRLVLEYRNWRPAVVLNKQPVGNSAAEADFSLFWTVWEKVSANYVDKNDLDPKKMVDGAISGMVGAIGDPYTVYLPVVQNKESKEELGGEFQGVGIQLGFKDSRLAVVAPLPETPAAKAGIKPGDLILNIKDDEKEVDRNTEGITLPEAVSLIRGPGKSEVILTLVREGVTEPFEVKLIREVIVVKSVILGYKDFPENNGRKVAWLQLTRFGDKTQEEWGEAVSQIVQDSDIAGIVLDLRNNPGGYLDLAVYLAGEFLSPGKKVVTQQYGDGNKTEGEVNRNGRLLKQKLVVLVNKGSASASEILAGALQDHKRGKIVGEKTFGKGSVQQPEDFPDGSGVHITVAKWLRPNGEWLDKVGITPDVEVKPGEKEEETGEDAQLARAIELLK